jgi:protein-S-isoprenylcysteine O-methyltransferase Ste14
MSPAVAIAFITLFFLGPIPLWHLLLHGFLPAWKRSPLAYYSVSVALWILFVPLAWVLAQWSPLLFEPSQTTRVLGVGASGAALLVAVWSMLTLTPRRFFLWAVLRPGDIRAERILGGPYRFTEHPTYVAIVLATASNFVASGSTVLLGAAAAMGILLAAVAVLEQRELNERLRTSLPEQELAPSPLTTSPRD